jgi:Flp pilus assembly protein TadB
VRSVFEMIILACSIVGLMSAAHLATLLVRERVVSALDMAKIVTGVLAVTSLSLILHRPRGLLQFWFQVETPFAIGIASAFLLAKHRDRAFEESLDDLLSRLMMRMKEGRSLSVALELVASEMRSAIRLRWIEMARSVSFSPQKNTSSQPKSLKFGEILREFQRIDRLSRSQIAELERWRLRVRTDRIFRRRSVQAMAQVRAQSLILATVFILLSLFSVSAFGWSATRGPLQLSSPVFILGLAMIWRRGSRVKWSV